MERYKDEFEYDFLSDDNRRLAVTESDYNSLVDNNMYTVTPDILLEETVAAEEILKVDNNTAAEKLMWCRDIVKTNTKMFSNFRSWQICL